MGNPISPSLIKPKLRPELVFYWQAFIVLSSERQGGMAMMEIPARAIFWYADRYKVKDAEFFYEVIRRLDIFALRHFKKRSDSSQESI